MAEAQFKDIMMQPKLEFWVNPNRLIQNIPHQPDVVVDKPTSSSENVPVPAAKGREETLLRKRGRPRKEKEDTPKRPRGRPCKNPVDWTEYILPNPNFAPIVTKNDPEAPESSKLAPSTSAPLPPAPLPRPKIKLHLSDGKKSNEAVALNFVHRLLGIRRPRGRPRLHPQRDPSLPKRPRGRPRHDDPTNPMHRVVSQARSDAEAQLMNLVANAIRGTPKEPKEEPQTEANFSGFALNSSRESDTDKQSDELNGNEDSADAKDFYPQIEYLDTDSPLYRNLWRTHRLADREVIFPKCQLEKVLDENLLICLPGPEISRKDLLVSPSTVSRCTCGYDVAESECGRYMALKLRPNKSCEWYLGMERMEGVRFLWPFKHF